MSIADSNRKKSKTDVYPTLPEQISCLINNFSFEGLNIIDAGSGDGRIGNTIKESCNASCVDFAEISDGVDFLAVNKRYDMVVSNPPFSIKREFISHSMDIAENVIMLLPLQVLNYISFCNDFLDNGRYLGRVTMYPKLFMNSDGIYKQGGNTGYGWFVWNSVSEDMDGSKYEFFEDIRKYRV